MRWRPDLPLGRAQALPSVPQRPRFLGDGHPALAAAPAPAKCPPSHRGADQPDD